MTSTGAGAPPLHAETTPLDGPHELITRVDPRQPLLWQRGGAGLAGLGEALRLEFSGPDRIREASAAWRELSAAAVVANPLGAPGTGLVAFGAFAFSSRSSATSVLIVPRVVIGSRGGRSWVTRIRTADETAGSTAVRAPLPFGDEFRLPLLPGAMTPDAYRAAVASAVGSIRSGALEKVVLARDLQGRLPRDADRRRLLRDLANGYPDCWTFAVDGFLGASPETLVGVDQGAVTARVLAGTSARGGDAEEDAAIVRALLASPKDRSEHAFAIASLLRELRPHTGALTTTPEPFALKLPNLWHLATDVRGTLDDASTALDLVDALHPTAAVAGTPTDRALALLEELEPFDRGRYAGPVGWIDGNGDGEWAVGLRSAQVTPDGAVTAWAGAGIVADSDPATELAETGMKFRPILDALS
ncbi:MULTISPECIES: isochorismate synthase MenF [unclassified Rathayibacter]|uniref:isochorismate synthase n=1 Tax=unclassified Rathayibacter TaxID=2609250 RepID=UPI001FB52D67|nr:MULTISPECIES: isochorismate synthase [unclassified Rathayibacter]MCJ1671997.1 isochorismate synthase [Rathayibacter sp. VKM Ac-2929]MCJ1683833.1 isochorismate synthase [Rathayibacter sp. VKM Ac-2928]